jgi:hypothetical protein
MLGVLSTRRDAGGSNPPLSLAPCGDGHRTSELTMAIRKNLAKTLINAAKAVEKDQTKEKVGNTIFAARVGLANLIMPKIPPVKR